jgi:tRNA U34 5-methylaminomethyl-2-thiouridine-forming methyltransferase MnmC
MERLLQSTADGSHTISIPAMEVTYHSKHGAIQESNHVFLDAGLNKIADMNLPEISILEMGFGTGLNALLTLIRSGKKSVRYESLETFPISAGIVQQLNYCEILERRDLQPLYENMHASPWESEISITDTFVLIKRNINLINFHSDRKYHLIYFDAFAPRAQPELWTEQVFSNLFSVLEPNGILVTYCSKSIVRKAMQAAGFKVEKIPGPRGKREMLRAYRYDPILPSK